MRVHRVHKGRHSLQKFGRRQALAMGVAAATVSRFHSARAATYPPLSATVTLNGQSFVFREDQGTDLGDFVSDIGGFTQRCIRSEVPGCPLTIFFRPDRTSDRAEVVFELGDLFNSKPVNLGAYTVAIARNGQTLANINVPQHYWFSRWRWQSATRPIVGDVDKLMAQNLLPHYYVTPGSATASPPPPETKAQVPAPSPAPSNPSVQTVTGNIQPGDFSGMRGVSMQVGQEYKIQTSAPAGAQLLVTVALNGAYLANNLVNLTLSPTFTFKPVAAGSYSIVVASINSTPGNYSIQVSNANSAAPAAAVETETAKATATAVATTAYAIMGLAGITPNMGQTGERGDIGLVTGPQGEYICTRSASSLASVRAQAEAAGTVPWHMRDENTGAPIDFRTYPKAGWYVDASVSSPYIPSTTTPITVDSAHQPALAYVPYLLTGDPYHLEDLQFAANWNWGTLPPNYRPSIPQARAFAWSTRTLAQAARVTPKTVPSWLLPQAYWAQMLTTTRSFFEADYVNSTKPERARFRATGNMEATREEVGAPAGTWVDPWQDEFVSTVLGWIVTMGFTEWRTAFDWVVGGAIARSNGRSGWARAYASPYRMIVKRSATAPVAASWAEAWATTKQVESITTSDTEKWASSDLTYLGYLRGALTYAQRLNTADVSEALRWAEAQFSAYKWTVDFKWRLLAS